MTSRRNAQESEPAGEIHLRQTAQVSSADQTRTFEIAVTLPVGASAEEITRAIEGAEMGMRGLSAQMDQQISAFRDEAITARPVVTSLPPAPTTNGNGKAALPPPTPEPEHPIEAEAEPETQAEPVAEELAPTVPQISSSDFYRSAKALGYSATAAQKALGLATMVDIDYGEALDRLRELAAKSAAPATETPKAAKPRGFKEEIGPEDAPPPEDDGYSLPDDLDEPDFAPVLDDGDEPETEGDAKPDTAAIRRRAAAEKRLRDLRALRGSGPPATPEQRQALGNCFITPLGSDFARDLVAAIWHPIPGERLNAARTRNLVEWSKEDEDFEETAALIFDLARQPVAQEEE